MQSISPSKHLKRREKFRERRRIMPSQV